MTRNRRFIVRWFSISKFVKCSYGVEMNWLVAAILYSRLEVNSYGASNRMFSRNPFQESLSVSLACDKPRPALLPKPHWICLLLVLFGEVELPWLHSDIDSWWCGNVNGVSWLRVSYICDSPLKPSGLWFGSKSDRKWGVVEQCFSYARLLGASYTAQSNETYLHRRI